MRSNSISLASQAAVFSCAMLCGTLALGGDRADPDLHLLPSAAKGEFVASGHRLAKELDGLSDRLKGLIAAHDAGASTGMSKQERLDLRRQAADTTGRLQQVLDGFWRADAEEKVLLGTQAYVIFLRTGAVPRESSAVAAVLEDPGFPTAMGNSIGRAEEALTREAASFEAAESRRTAALYKRIAFLTAALVAIFFALRARRNRGGSHQLS